MKVTDQKIEDRQAFLTIELEPDQVDEAMRKAARTAARSTRIPGFRPGKAPYTVVLAMVGRDALLDEVISDLGAEAIDAAIKEQGLNAYDVPHVDVLNREPVTLQAVVPLMPHVTLGDYENIRVARPEVTVDDAQVNGLLSELQSENAEVIPVERGAQMGDELVADVKGTIGDETISDQNAVTFPLTEAAVRNFPPGFADQIVGMNAGETRTFHLTYPADFSEEDLAGKDVAFTVTVDAVKERRLPPIDDDLARTVGDFENVDALKARLRENLEAQANRRADAELREKAIDELVKISTVEFPPVMVEQEVDRMIEDQREMLRQSRLTLEQYLRAREQTLDELRDELRPLARDRLIRSLVLGELVEQEHITVEPGEAEAAGMSDSRLLAEKAIQRLLDTATAS